MFGLFGGDAGGSDYGNRMIACRGVGIVAYWDSHVPPSGARSIFQVANGGWQNEWWNGPVRMEGWVTAG